MYPRLHDVAIKGKDYSEVFHLDVCIREVYAMLGR